MMSNENIENRILQLLPELVGRLPNADLENVKTLVSHSEWGIGLETLCTQIDEYEIELSTAEIEKLKLLAAELEVDVSYLRG